MMDPFEQECLKLIEERLSRTNLSFSPNIRKAFNLVFEKTMLEEGCYWGTFLKNWMDFEIMLLVVGKDINHYQF